MCGRRVVVGEHNNVPAPPDTTVTKTKINAAKHKARFGFEAIGAADRFQCKLKRKHARKRARFTRCASPKTYKQLRADRYVLTVRAVGPSGPDPTPAKNRFRIR